jgi:hypothetical protein
MPNLFGDFDNWEPIGWDVSSPSIFKHHDTLYFVLITLNVVCNACPLNLPSKKNQIGH